MFEARKFRQEQRRREKLTPDQRFTEDVIACKWKLLYAEMALSELARHADSETLRDFFKERHDTVQEIRLEFEEISDIRVSKSIARALGYE